MELTRGVVATIAESERWHAAPVVLQVVDTVRIPPMVFRHSWPGGPREGCALVLSDGLHTLELDLITPLRNLARDGRVRRGSIIRLLSYCTLAGYGPSFSSCKFCKPMSDALSPMSQDASRSTTLQGMVSS